MNKHVAIRTLGQAAFIQCDITGKDLKRAIKLVPEAAKLTDGKGNDKFAVAVGDYAVLKDYLVQFKVTKENENDFVNMTVTTDRTTMTKDELMEDFGSVILKLNNVIETLINYSATYADALNVFFDDEEEPVVDLTDELVTPVEEAE